MSKAWAEYDILWLDEEEQHDEDDDDEEEDDEVELIGDTDERRKVECSLFGKQIKSFKGKIDFVVNGSCLITGSGNIILLEFIDWNCFIKFEIKRCLEAGSKLLLLLLFIVVAFVLLLFIKRKHSWTHSE